MSPRLLTVLLLLLLAPVLACAQETEARQRYLVVLGDPALEEALEPLLDLRREQGLVVSTIPTDERGALDAEIARRAPDFLLLAGDVDTIPAFDLAKVATDRPYGDFDDDGYPEAAIGRFPSSDVQAISRLAARTVLYERSHARDAWQKQCALIAGRAGFSPQADAVIEGLFRQIVRDEIDPAFDVDLTYANPRSPYCYPVETFSERVQERINQGALVCAYVGHGQVRSVDDLTIKVGKKKRSYTVLEASQAKSLATGLRSPVFLAIACWTGRYEGTKPCIGEELLLASEGPVAFFGSSRVSHPVHNALLAKELVRELFDGPGALRLGPALDRARKAMVLGRPGEPDPIRLQMLGLASAFLGEEALHKDMPRHVDMYNLLGDPALVLARPDRRVELLAPPEAKAGDAIEVRGVALGFQRVRLTFETPRDRCAVPDAPEGETPLQRYERVNHKVVFQAEVAVDEVGAFVKTIELPRSLLSGTYRVKAFAVAEGRTGIGSRPVKVAADPDHDPFDDEDGWDDE